MRFRPLRVKKTNIFSIQRPRPTHGLKKTKTLNRCFCLFLLIVWIRLVFPMCGKIGHLMYSTVICIHYANFLSNYDVWEGTGWLNNTLLFFSYFFLNPKMTFFYQSCRNNLPINAFLLFSLISGCNFSNWWSCCLWVNKKPVSLKNYQQPCGHHHHASLAYIHSHTWTCDDSEVYVCVYVYGGGGTQCKRKHSKEGMTQWRRDQNMKVWKDPFTH